MFKISLLLLAFSITVHAQTEKIVIKGDLRFRSEHVKDQVGNLTTERNRHRLRARLNVQAPVNDNTDAIFRIATGDTAATSTNGTNADLTNFGAKKPFNLDLAFANWKPSETAQIWLGKSLVPYQGTSDLLFDTDLTAEGLSYKDLWKMEDMALFWNAGYWLLNERHPSGTVADTQTDVTLVGLDVGVTQKIGDLGYTVGAGAYAFNNIKDTTAPASLGNTLIGGAYVNEYKITRGFAEVTIPVAGLPFAFFGDYAVNEDPADDNTAYMVGIKAGKLGEISSWTVAIDSRELKKDGTVAVLTDGDMSNGGTDIKGMRYVLQYQAAQNTVVALTHLDSKKNVSTTDTPFKRTILDFNFSF